MFDGLGRVKLPPASVPSFTESILSHLVPGAPLMDPPAATPAGGDVPAGASARSVSADVEVWQDLPSRTIFVYLPSPGDPPPVGAHESYLALKEQEHVFLRRAVQVFSSAHLVLIAMPSSRFDPSVLPLLRAISSAKEALNQDAHPPSQPDQEGPAAGGKGKDDAILSGKGVPVLGFLIPAPLVPSVAGGEKHTLAAFQQAMEAQVSMCLPPFSPRTF
ncbi:hypothetical protein T484DRAFT_1786576 [Baffinella frigidus]|nr:hypothetical protein T484DRAFT_1786576 [Cryptophyta sp. CCMP2293]